MQANLVAFTGVRLLLADAYLKETPALVVPAAWSRLSDGNRRREEIPTVPKPKVQARENDAKGSVFCRDSTALRPCDLRLTGRGARKICASAGNQLDCPQGAGAPGPDESDAWVPRSESPYPKPAIAALPG